MSKMKTNGFYTCQQLCRFYPELAQRLDEEKLKRWHQAKMIDAIHDIESDRWIFRESDVLLLLELKHEMNQGK